MSWAVDIYLQGIVNDSNSKEIKNQFERYCDWCWGHGFGNCDKCRHRFKMVYLPIRIEERKRELGLVKE